MPRGLKPPRIIAPAGVSEDFQAKLAALARWENPNITFQDPAAIRFWQRGRGCNVWDSDGNRYVDLTSAFSVMSIGHGNPAVVRGVKRQAGDLLHAMGDVHPATVKTEWLKALGERLPEGFGGIFPTGGGAEAVEAALKTARLASGKPGILSFHGSYHGLSYGALSATGIDQFRTPFENQLGLPVTRLPFPSGGGFSAEHVLSKLPKEVRANIGAVITEPIQGRGGVLVPPKEYLREVRRLADALDAVFILDEIFTGWYRTGTRFGFETYGGTPDLLCLGKAMGGGLPIGAVTGRSEVMAAWPKSQGEALHTSTFLGNPVVLAASIAAMNELDRQRNDALWVDKFITKVAQLDKLHVSVGLRGRGAMWGIDLLGLKGPHDEPPAVWLSQQLLAKGYITLPSGGGEVLQLTPPFQISKALLAGLFQAIDDIASRNEHKLALAATGMHPVDMKAAQASG